MIHYYNKNMTNAEIIGPITRNVLAAEIWVRSSEFHLYEISTVGRLRRAHTRELVKPYQACKGYLSVHIQAIFGKFQPVKIARLMTDAFFNRRDGYQLDHRNGNRALNCLFNLRYVPASVNQRNRKDTVMVEWNNTHQPLLDAIEAVFGASNPQRYQYIASRIRKGESFTDASIQRAQFEQRSRK